MKAKNNHNTALSLDAMRRQFGITLREIAERMNMSVTHVHWVVADPTPTAEQVRAVEEVIKAIIREREGMIFRGAARLGGARRGNID